MVKSVSMLLCASKSAFLKYHYICVHITVCTIQCIVYSLNVLLYNKKVPFSYDITLLRFQFILPDHIYGDHAKHRITVSHWQLISLFNLRSSG